jgi:predicted GIY-YIG superfamily endonuclease
MDSKEESDVKSEKKKRMMVRLPKGISSLLDKIFRSRWVLYILISENKRYTYCGITVNFCRRFAQHLGILKKGARYTKMHSQRINLHAFSWEPVCIVSGFVGEKGTLARKLEWKMHHVLRHKAFKTYKDQFLYHHREYAKDINKNSGIYFRLIALYFFLQELPCYHDCRVHWFHPEYKNVALWEDTDHEVRIDQQEVSMKVFDELLPLFLTKA